MWALVAAILLVVASGSASAASPHYRTKPGVRLSPEVRAKLVAIADRYHEATRRTLLVTSGTRSPREQAAAMYGKLRAGDRLWVYRDQRSVKPIRAAYDRGRRRRWKRARIVAAMTEIIADQVARGVYISRHLRAHAFDVRCYNMSRRQKRAFRAAAKAVGHVRIIEEKRPPHFHCEVRPPKKVGAPVADDGPTPGADAGASADPDGGSLSDASPGADASVGADSDEADAGCAAD